MATKDLTPLPNGSVSADITTLICKAYPLEALLTGALTLLECELDKGAETTGNVWAAFNIIKVAKEKATEIWMYSDDLRVIDRAKALEVVGEPFGISERSR
jgi:hypothetical protein